MSRAGRTRGFTLLELLVVLTIVAGVLAIVPLVSERGARNAEIDGAARVLLADLRWLRQAAIRERHETNLVVDADGSRYLRWGDPGFRPLPNGIVIAHKPLATAGPRREAQAIVFYPDGTTSGGELALRSATQSLVVHVSWPFGRIETDRRRG
jgi:general secretion pathway protein H